MILPSNQFTSLRYNVLENPEDLEFREKSKKLYDYYRGKQAIYLNAVYNDKFKNWSTTGSKKVDLRTVNIVEKILSELSRVYEKEPVRRITIDGVVNEELTEKYNEATNSLHKLLRLSEAETLSILQRTILINPEWDFDKNKLRYRVFPPFLIDVISSSNNSDKIEAVLYKIKVLPKEFGAGLDEEVAYVYWDGEHNYLIRDDETVNIPIEIDGEIVNRYYTLDEIAENPELYNSEFLKNQYGIIPFAVLRDSVEISNSFWAPLDDTWISLQDAINKATTEQDTAIFRQAFSQIWANTGGNAGAEATEIEMSRLNILNLGFEGSLNALNLDSHLPEIAEAREGMIRMFAWLKNVGGLTDSETQNLSSGVAILATKHSTVRAIEKRKKFCRAMELDLFEIEKAIINQHADFTIPENAELQIQFDDIMNLLSVDERIKKDEHDLQTGSTTQAEIYMRNHPEVKSLDEAKERVLKNKRFQNQLNSRFSGLNNPEISEAMENLTNNESEE